MTTAEAIAALPQQDLARICAQATSIRDVLRRLDLKDTPVARRHLEQRCYREGITLPRHGKRRPPTPSQIEAACKGATSRRDVLRTLGMGDAPADYARLDELADGHAAVLDLPQDGPRRGRSAFDEAQLRTIAATARDTISILHALGLAPTDKERKALARFAAAHGIPLPKGSGKGTGLFTDRDRVGAALDGATSLRGALIRLGVDPGTANRNRMRAAASRFGFPLPVEPTTYGGVPLEDLLRPRVEIKNPAAFKKKLVGAGILSEECERCGLGPTWQGRPLTLQLNHVNGDRLGQRRENLRLLCPNCQTQTPTFAARNGVRAQRAE